MTEHIISHPKKTDLNPGCFKPRILWFKGCRLRGDCIFSNECLSSGYKISRKGRFTLDDVSFKKERVG